MSNRAAGVNRFWLCVLGLIMIVAGALGVGIGTGWIARIPVPVASPEPGESVLAGPVTDQVVVMIMVGAGLVILITGIAWLVRQLPRRESSRPFRLHDDPADGITTVDPAVVGDAMRGQLESFRGIAAASVGLRGSVRRPELTIKITADERADLTEVLGRIRSQAVADLELALDSTVTRLAIQVEIDRARGGVAEIRM
ncbi:Asp23/Gls24 family envelope stress response protein [Microlunatus parietis]|uniref:Alkaline shock response membrane anchor protein AmaP n=1 Tax=Microlunatus parietis TaxID=682979 RepID=A0A7Y9I8B7_9ACTN|nr:hypothetical protein [Microlunatus parietis]NYE71935.1 hypothetical protein [Microlunatus parietis]